MRMVGQALAEHIAPVMIAQHEMHGQALFLQQQAQGLVGGSFAAVRQVAGKNDAVGVTMMFARMFQQLAQAFQGIRAMKPLAGRGQV